MYLDILKVLTSGSLTQTIDSLNSVYHAAACCSVALAKGVLTQASFILPELVQHQRNLLRLAYKKIHRSFI